MSLDAHGNALPEGYRLREYRIARVLGQGGFGITYLAMDTSLDRQVAIKEYLPKDFAVREDSAMVRPFTEDRKKLFEWGLQRFIEEARTLAKFQHPNIVRVYTVFELHGTAYMAMQFEQGEGLDKLYRENRGNAEADLLRIALPLLDGLECIHQAGFIHRDIKPANIYVRLDGSPVLLDFGSARMAIGGETRTLTSLVTPGFAPYEQYHNDSGKQGPWTDIYGLGATLYAGLNRGRGPLDAIVRGNARMEGKPDPMDSAAVLGQGRYSDAWLQAIDAALRFMAADRPQSIRQWRALFPGMAAASASAPPDRPAADQETIPATGFAGRPAAIPKLQPKSQPKADAARPHASAPPRIARRVALLLVLALAAGLLWWYQQGPDWLFTLLNSPAEQARQAAKHQRTAKAAARLQAEVQARARADRLAQHKAPGTVFRDTLRDGSKGLEMVVVPAGSFRMGDLQGGDFSSGNPVYSVRIVRPFAIGKYEVTFAEYDRFARATGRNLPSDQGWGRGNRPVINVSWDDATAYAGWLSAETGMRYRLPSEAEWEYAARAGSETKYPWGNAIEHNRANCDGCGSRWDTNQTAPVGSFAANPWGVYDTVGNVSEWTQGCGQSSCSFRVIRGGSWNLRPWNVRSAFRYGLTTDLRINYLGFRLAQDI